MRTHRAFVLLVFLSLVGCSLGERPGAGVTGTAIPSTTFTAAAGAVAATTATQTTEVLPATAMPGAQPTSASGVVEWEGLGIVIPAKHRWQVMPPDTDPINGSTVLTQGRVAFDPTQQTTGEMPDGITFRIVQFSDSLDVWLARAQDKTASINPVDPGTITTRSIIGWPARAYSHMVIGVSRSESYIVKLTSDRLLLITVGDADNPQYQDVLSKLTAKSALKAR